MGDPTGLLARFQRRRRPRCRAAPLAPAFVAVRPARAGPVARAVERVAAPVRRGTARLAKRLAPSDAAVARAVSVLLLANAAFGLGVAGARATLPGVLVLVLVLVAAQLVFDLALCVTYRGRCPGCAKRPLAAARWLATKAGLGDDPFHVDSDTRVMAYMLMAVPGVGLFVEALWTFRHRGRPAAWLPPLAAAKVALYGCLVVALLRQAAIRRRRDVAYRQQREWDAVQDIVAGLRVRVADDSDGRARTCCVCQEPLVGGEDAVALPCAHLLHATCAAQWWLNSPSCPLCKGPVSPDRPRADKPAASRRPRGRFLRRLAHLLAAKAYRDRARRVAAAAPPADAEERKEEEPRRPSPPPFDAIPDV